MAEFTMAEVLAATGAKLLREVEERVFTGVSTDTRTIQAGNLFLALEGKNFDGHKFTMQACQNGARGVIVSKERGDVEALPDTAVMLVEGGTLKALQNLAKFHRRRFSIPVVGVTGSNGKTTTKELIAAMLSGKFKVLKTENNYNNEIGLPLTILNLTGEHEAAVLEMAMRARGEIKALAEIAQPTIAVVTNVSQTHVELLGSIENVALAKAELVEALDENGVAVLNYDNKYVREMAAKNKGRTIFYGLTKDALVHAESIIENVDDVNTTFICWGPRNGFFSVIVPLLGAHNVSNSLAAMAVNCELGLTALEIQAGLAVFRPADMRQTIIRKGAYTIINDAYNASPNSMAAAIEVLAEVAKGRKIAVLGDMLELGREAKEAHEKIGELLAQKSVDALFTVGEMSKYLAARARERGVPYVAECLSHHHAKEELVKYLLPGDTALFKGSRGMEMEKVLELIDFSLLR